MITWLKINFGQWPDHVDRPNKFLRCHVSTLLTSQNKEKKLTLDSLQAQNYLLLGLLLNHLRWLNTVLAVCEYTSFAKSRQEKGCSSQAETWQVKNILMKEFDWQVKCDVFMVSMATWTIEYNLWLATTFSTVHRSTQTKNHAALPLVRLDLSQSAKNWHDFTTQYYRYHSLSAFCFCLCFPITSFFKKKKNVEKKKS